MGRGNYCQVRSGSEVAPRQNRLSPTTTFFSTSTSILRTMIARNTFKLHYTRLLKHDIDCSEVANLPERFVAKQVCNSWCVCYFKRGPLSAHHDDAIPPRTLVLLTEESAGQMRPPRPLNQSYYVWISPVRLVLGLQRHFYTFVSIASLRPISK